MFDFLVRLILYLSTKGKQKLTPKNSKYFHNYFIIKEKYFLYRKVVKIIAIYVGFLSKKAEFPIYETFLGFY